MLVFIACGLLDVMRNDRVDLVSFHRYFLGHGTATWVMAPINLLVDCLCLPFTNKKIYQAEQLPEAHRNELLSVIQAMKDDEVVKQLNAKLANSDREMLFFKWYGQHLDNDIDTSINDTKYQYLESIGVSVFKQQKSTSKHFGPMRFTIRALYNLNDISSDQAFIRVGNTEHRWCENKLFIFDDTLEHQSFNQTDEIRYCAFIDIVRPSPFPKLLQKLTSLVGAGLRQHKHKFYNNWTFIR